MSRTAAVDALSPPNPRSVRPKRPPGDWLFRPVDAATLVCFRALFGGLMLWDVLALWPRREAVFPPWEFRPAYPWLAFAEPWLRPGLDWLLLGMGFAALGVMLGLFYRAAGVLLCVTFTAIFLSDPTHFNNHFYLIALIAAWLPFVGAHRGFSLDALRSRAIRSAPVPRWQLAILQAHFLLAYFFGGIAKLNADWLRGEPMRVWLAVESEIPLIGPWLAKPWAGYVFSYGGLAFDLLIPFLLVWRRTRYTAIAATVAFHVSNHFLFEIGVFPFVMIAANVLFLAPDAPRRLAPRWFGKPGPSQSLRPRQPALLTSERRRNGVVIVLALYAAVHLLLPFRHFLYAGNVEWTEEGKNFAWRMMLSHKDTFVGILVIDRATGRVWEVDQREHLTRRQMRGKGVWGNPRLLAQYARFLKRRALEAGMTDPMVRVDAVASLNGRPFQFLVDPDVDLASAEDLWWRTAPWIVPLKPDQPIGDYAMSMDEKFRRVMAVIDAHRRSPATR